MSYGDRTVGSVFFSFLVRQEFIVQFEKRNVFVKK